MFYRLFARDIEQYEPVMNSRTVHLLSYLRLCDTRFATASLKSCSVKKSPEWSKRSILLQVNQAPFFLTHCVCVPLSPLVTFRTQSKPMRVLKFASTFPHDVLFLNPNPARPKRPGNKVSDGFLQTTVFKSSTGSSAPISGQWSCSLGDELPTGRLPATSGWSGLFLHI